ncbi:MAG: prolipoprotein diacylglyceryl transferase [Deltaproteobacteria bacterium]
MIDSHFYPSGWGVKPILFNIAGFEIPSYSAFVLLGLIVGVLVFYIDAKRQKVNNENTFFIVAAAFTFGALGAKLPIWIANYKLILVEPTNLSALLSGRTIVGGLIGGTLGVILTKRVLKIKDKRGNQFAPAAAIGIAIGRVGCFLRGCCYGIPTYASWGVNFGDGIPRHPTQLYEAVFDLGLFIYLIYLREKITEPGKLFRIFLNWYFVFRFFIEFIRIEKVVFFGLTGFQLVSLMVLVYLNRRLIFNGILDILISNKKIKARNT